MNCHICLKSITSNQKYDHYHDKCLRLLFGTSKIDPVLDFDREEFFSKRSRQHTRRTSISGVQPKLGAKIVEAKLETSGENFTHILKPTPEGFSEAAANEHLTMEISRNFGIETARCGLVRFKTGDFVYCTLRFDKTPSGYIHQEDMMQALGVHPRLNTNAKYDAKSYEDVGIFLREKASLPIVKEFFRRVLFNFLMSNDDYHLKNISIQYVHGYPHSIKLAPHYDALNTGVFGLQESELALDLLNSNDGFSQPYQEWGYHTKGCFDEFAEKLGLPQKSVNSIYRAMLSNKEKVGMLVDNSLLSEDNKVKFKEEVDSRFTKFRRGYVY